MSGKPPASRTCWFACRGNRQLPGLADSHVRETVSFPDLLSPQSGGRRRCFKSIRAGRNIRDQYVVVEDHEAIRLRIDAGSIAGVAKCLSIQKSTYSSSVASGCDRTSNGIILEL